MQWRKPSGDRMREGFVRSFTTAIALLSAYCSRPDERWRIESPELYGPFESAALEWCEASGGSYCPHVDQTATDQIVRSDSSSYMSEGHRCGHYHAIWWPDRGSEWEILIAVERVNAGHCWPARRRDAILRRLIAHELGHAAGPAAGVACWRGGRGRAVGPARWTIDRGRENSTCMVPVAGP